MRMSFLLLVAFLTGSASSSVGQALPATGSPQDQSQQSSQIDKVRAEVQKRGTGEKSRVRVTRTSGQEVKGYISNIGESSFTVTNKKTGQASTIPYADTRNVRGPGLSKGAKIGIGVGIGIGVTAGVFAAVVCGGTPRIC